ncbi:MAG: hypothetical protein PHS37_09925 [Candidatus Omnitrophica bacterium]|nr:hypothetical protein [Candidatus Omnitrophota bacterium]
MTIRRNRKLFGIFNLLDIVVVAFILVLIVPGIHYYIKFNEKGIAEQKLLERYLNWQENSNANTGQGQTGSMCLDVCFKNVPAPVLKLMKAGDKEIGPQGIVLAEIIWLGTPEAKYFVSGCLREEDNVSVMLNSADKNLYSVPATIRFHGVIGNGGAFLYKIENLAGPTPKVFSCPGYDASFILESTGLPKYIRHKSGYIDVSVSVKNLDEGTLKKIQLHDKKADANGITVWEITAVGQPVRNYYYIPGSAAEPVRLTPEDGLYALPVTMRLWVDVNIDRTFFCEGRRVVEFSAIPLVTGSYSVTGVVEKFVYDNGANHADPEK